MQSTRWCFTINNYTPDDEQRLERLGGDLDGNAIRYLVFGREVGERGGTPHLQGYVVFGARKRLNAVRDIIGRTGHYEVARGGGHACASYCRKDGNFVEFGDAPRKPRSAVPSVTDFCDWVRGLDIMPSQHEIANKFPGLFIRYGPSKMVELATHIMPPVILQDGELKPWQFDLEAELLEEPDDRTVVFYVDKEGGAGKSWFCRFMLSKYREKVQVLCVGKRDDLAHAIDQTKSIFLFNIPRGGMELLQYPVLEMLKDRVVFSPKYNSTTKILSRKAHVVVFSNEDPDVTKLSADRWSLREVLA
nr:MAG: replication polyprotein [Skomarfal virus 54]